MTDPRKIPVGHASGFDGVTPDAAPENRCWPGAVFRVGPGRILRRGFPVFFAMIGHYMIRSLRSAQKKGGVTPQYASKTYLKSTQFATISLLPAAELHSHPPRIYVHCRLPRIHRARRQHAAAARQEP